MENKLDGSTAYKVIDGDKMTLLRIFHDDRRQEMLTYYSGLGKYGEVVEDIDGDIICFEDTEDNDY